MNLTDPIFQDDAKARKWLESQVWPYGPVCPHCGNADAGKIKALEGKAHRSGLFKCNECREQFTVTVGTVMERSKIPLRKWAMAMFLMAASKKGISAHQLHRMMDIPYKTAWFLCHRIREAMREGKSGQMGGNGKVVEVDETYFGKKAEQPKQTTSGRPFTSTGKSGPSGKRAVVSLVERGGSARTFHVDNASQFTIEKILRENVARDANIHTDESRLYHWVSAYVNSHSTVKHSSGEYVRYEKGGVTHSNTVENYFSVFKRGMRGTYQHCAEKHLQRAIQGHRIAKRYS